MSFNEVVLDAFEYFSSSPLVFLLVGLK